MDLVTWVTACAAAVQAELFVPLGVHDICEASTSSAAASPPLARESRMDGWAPVVTAAARRFGVPESWVRAVMQLESAGAPNARSRAGAVGLMQVMPRTYAEVTARYGLGDDPGEPAANVAAGTAYLREMLDRFGTPDAFAAYNAGPGRVLDHLLYGRSLPEETRRYLDRLRRELPDIGGAPGAPSVTTGQATTPVTDEPQRSAGDAPALQRARTVNASTMQRGRRATGGESALFVQLPSTSVASPLHDDRSAGALSDTPSVARGGPLFVPLRDGAKAAGR